MFKIALQSLKNAFSIFIYKKLCQVKIGMFGKKKLEKHFLDFFALKRLKTAFWNKVKNEILLKSFFRFIFQRNLKQTLKTVWSS